MEDIEQDGPHLISGKERDQESGLDDFGARHYASTMGRFMSPDWSDVPTAVPYADTENPQSLNLYEYAGNNPLSRVDLDGHCDDGSTQCWLQTHAPEVAAALEDAESSFSGSVGKLNRAAGQLTGRGEFTLRDSGDRAALASTIGSGANAALGVIVPFIFTDGLSLDAELAETTVNLAEKPLAEGPELQNIIDQLYKPSDQFPGGTAGAVRQELATGGEVGGKTHTIKALERASQLEKKIASGKFSGRDLQTAKAIAQDLRDAVAGK